MSGKTIGALRRNVVGPLKRMLASRGYHVHDNRSENVLTVTRGLISNRFFLFGGRDESSQDLIAGITLAGMFFDEVALMPKSFVDQATARCSVDGAKLWFNCNPSGPYHWFKRNGWTSCRRSTRCTYTSQWRIISHFLSVYGSGTGACTAGSFISGTS